MTKIKNCVTHHHACDCREEKFTKLQEENEFIKDRVDVLKGYIKLIGGMAGIPDPKEGCMLISKRVNKILAWLDEVDK